MDPGAIQSWNLYVYVRNLPLTLLDPDGRKAIVNDFYLTLLSEEDALECREAVREYNESETGPRLDEEVAALGKNRDFGVICHEAEIPGKARTVLGRWTVDGNSAELSLSAHEIGIVWDEAGSLNMAEYMAVTLAHERGHSTGKKGHETEGNNKPRDNEAQMRGEFERRRTEVRDPFQPLMPRGTSTSGADLPHDCRYTWGGVGGGKKAVQ